MECSEKAHAAVIAGRRASVGWYGRFLRATKAVGGVFCWTCSRSCFLALIFSIPLAGFP